MFEKFWSRLDLLLLVKSYFIMLYDQKPFETRAIDAVRIYSNSLKQPRITKKEEFRKIWLLSKDIMQEKLLQMLM